MSRARIEHAARLKVESEGAFKLRPKERREIAEDLLRAGANRPGDHRLIEMPRKTWNRIAREIEGQTISPHEQAASESQNGRLHLPRVIPHLRRIRALRRSRKRTRSTLARSARWASRRRRSKTSSPASSGTAGRPTMLSASCKRGARPCRATSTRSSKARTAERRSTTGPRSGALDAGGGSQRRSGRRAMHCGMPILRLRGPGR